MTHLFSAHVQLEVPFHDADPAGLVWHGNYFRYLELARCAVLEQIGYNYRQMAESGFLWPLTDLRTRFTAPIRYGDRIDVSATLVEWEYRMVFEYEITGADGGTRARARSVQVPVDRETNELVIGAPGVFVRLVLAAKGELPKEDE